MTEQKNKSNEALVPCEECMKEIPRSEAKVATIGCRRVRVRDGYRIESLHVLAFRTERPKMSLQVLIIEI